MLFIQEPHSRTRVLLPTLVTHPDHPTHWFLLPEERDIKQHPEGARQSLLGPARASLTCTKVMYTLSTSGRSSRSTLMHTKCSFMMSPISLLLKDSSSMTWHQWQVE